MKTTDVLVILDPGQLPECEECCAPVFSMHSRIHSNETHYYERVELECENGHTRSVVVPPRLLDDDMRELFA